MLGSFARAGKDRVAPEIRPHPITMVSRSLCLGNFVFVMAGLHHSSLFIAPKNAPNVSAIEKPQNTLVPMRCNQTVYHSLPNWPAELDSIQLGDQLRQANQTLDKLQKSLETACCLKFDSPAIGRKLNHEKTKYTKECVSTRLPQ